MTVRVIRICSVAIMSLAAYTSFGHQQALLLSWGVDLQSSVITPITVDLLAIICTLAIHAPGVQPGGRRAAIFVLVTAGSVSVAANYISGGTLGSKIANTWAVVAYLLAEWVAAKVKAVPPVTAPAVDPKRSDAARRAHVTRKANASKTKAVTRTRKTRLPASSAPDATSDIITADSVAA